MNSLTIKALGFAVVLVLATIFVVTKLNIDIFADSFGECNNNGWSNCDCCIDWSSYYKIY